MATRHIITMLEKTLQVETENTISHLNVSLSDRFLSQSTAIHENNCYHTIGEWYKNHFLFQQDDFLWAKYVFYDAYCEEIKKKGLEIGMSLTGSQREDKKAMRKVRKISKSWTV